MQLDTHFNVAHLCISVASGSFVVRADVVSESMVILSLYCSVQFVPTQYIKTAQNGHFFINLEYA